MCQDKKNTDQKLLLGKNLQVLHFFFPLYFILLLLFKMVILMLSLNVEQIGDLPMCSYEMSHVAIYGSLKVKNIKRKTIVFVSSIGKKDQLFSLKQRKVRA